MENMPFDYRILTYKTNLHNFAISFTKNLDDANDLVQDTYVKAIKYANLYNEGTNLKAWLYTILKNTYFNNYRRNTTRSKIFTVTEDYHSHQLLKSSTTNAGVETLINEDINKALSMLPEDYSIPFLRYFEGYKYQEIAEEFSIPIGTVKTRIHMARKILKSKLKMYAKKNTRSGISDAFAS
ncbi:sigma-70 family RNA polymerase sigma factor [Pedobacter hartonius]|uniref:RNA polymerase, sigma subunit, ECF family n=1 Tax=Pedobacter hartonius TaxID=425514 RepID=A0A1H3W0Q9_9SPHI|nr:sigma-70 family RNA polymerase sigma factor [Pedobacter hartonius]SDZ80639.1 RNA polymerase, sigma subunit, ECF family [Pedobacter hartonius]